MRTATVDSPANEPRTIVHTPPGCRTPRAVDGRPVSPTRSPLSRLLAVWLVAGAANAVAADDGTIPIEERARSVRWISLGLHAERPDDLTVEFADRPEELRFAEFVYGTPESRRVAVVLVPGTGEQFTIYVDRNRDRIIRDRDLVEGTGEYRLLPLDAERIEDDIAHKHPRELLIHYRPGRDQVRIATATTIEHRVRPDGDEVQSELRIRQSDGNANGLFSDPRDLLQVDVNGDGRFDPFLEVFPFRPVLEVGGGRWFVRGDRFGERLELASASATGRLRLQAQLQNRAARIGEFVFMVSGEDGSVFSLTDVDEAVDLPVGRYAAAVLFLSIRSDGSDLARSYTFSRPDGPKADDWFDVSENAATTLNPIGTLTLDAVTEVKRRDAEFELEIQPRLFTETGLLINSCLLGDTNSYAGPQCRTTVLNAGRSIGFASSGFA